MPAGCFGIGVGPRVPELADLETKVAEVCEDPGGRRGKAGHGARIGEPRTSPGDVRHLLDVGSMVVTAADEVEIAGACERACVGRQVGREDASAAEGELGVLAVVADQPIRACAESPHRLEVTEVVAVNDMNWKTDGQERTQRVGADHVATVHDGRGASLAGGGNGARQVIGAVVAVGNDGKEHASRDRGTAGGPGRAAARSIHRGSRASFDCGSRAGHAGEGSAAAPFRGELAFAGLERGIHGRPIY